jgi:hypothetical protein
MMMTDGRCPSVSQFIPHLAFIHRSPARVCVPLCVRLPFSDGLGRPALDDDERVVAVRRNDDLVLCAADAQLHQLVLRRSSAAGRRGVGWKRGGKSERARIRRGEQSARVCDVCNVKHAKRACERACVRTAPASEDTPGSGSCFSVVRVLAVNCVTSAAYCNRKRRAAERERQRARSVSVQGEKVRACAHVSACASRGRRDARATRVRACVQAPGRCGAACGAARGAARPRAKAVNAALASVPARTSRCPASCGWGCRPR